MGHELGDTATATEKVARFGLELLDLGTGLVLICLALSLMCSAASELLAGFTNAQAKTLWKGITRLFEDTGFAGRRMQYAGLAWIRARRAPLTRPSRQH